jgi:hypothetical protein
MTSKAARALVGENLIRNVLITNGVASAACSLLLLAVPERISDLTGLESLAALRETGLALLVFAGFLIWAATRSVVSPRIVLAFAVIDDLWVIGSAIVLGESGSAYTLTEFGTLAVILVAVADALFAAFETSYYWRNRLSGK